MKKYGIALVILMAFSAGYFFNEAEVSIPLSLPKIRKARTPDPKALTQTQSIPKKVVRVEEVESNLRSEDPSLRLLGVQSAPDLPRETAMSLIPLLTSNITEEETSPNQSMPYDGLLEKSIEAILKIDPENLTVVPLVWKIVDGPLTKSQPGKIPQITEKQWVQFNNSILALAPKKLELVPKITEILKDKRPAGYYRIPSVVRLNTMIGGPHKDIPIAVSRALRSKQPAVVGNTCQLLESQIPIDKKPYLPDMKAAMKELSGVDPNRHQCAQALIAVEPEKKVVQSEYMQNLQSEDPVIRKVACENINALAMNNNEQQVVETVPLLITALKDENPAVRFAAASALGGFQSRAKNVVSVLLETLYTADGDDPSILGAATRSIVYLDPRNGMVAHALTGHLEKNNPHWRQRAARELAGLGKMARPAVPAFYKLLNNPSETLGVAAYAVQALINAGEDQRKLKALFEKKRADVASIIPSTIPGAPAPIAPWESQAAENVAIQLGILPGKVGYKLVNVLPGLE